MSSKAYRLLFYVSIDDYCKIYVLEIKGNIVYLQKIGKMMKRNLIFLLGLLICNSAFAQEIKRVFCEATIDDLDGNSITVRIDYGQKEQKDNLIVDKDGEKMYFYSKAGVLNYMSSLGWQIMEMDTVESRKTRNGGTNLYVTSEEPQKITVLYYKDVTSEDEMLNGIITKGTYKKYKKKK